MTLRRFARWMGFLLGTALLFYALDVPGDVARWRSLRRQVRELEQRNRELAREIEQRRERLRRFQTSEAERERHLREQQRKAKPGETIFILEEPPQQ